MKLSLVEKTIGAELVREAVARYGTRREAARALGISEPTLRLRLRLARKPDETPGVGVILCPRKNSPIAVQRCLEWQESDHCTCSTYRGFESGAQQTELLRRARIAATKLGLSVREYLEQRSAGRGWCSVCRQWHPEASFYTTARGVGTTCISQTKRGMQIRRGTPQNFRTGQGT